MYSSDEWVQIGGVLHTVPQLTRDEFASFEAFLGHLVKSDRGVGGPKTPQPAPIEVGQVWMNAGGGPGYRRYFEVIETGCGWTHLRDLEWDGTPNLGHIRHEDWRLRRDFTCLPFRREV